MLDEEDDAIAAFIRDSSITVISQSRFYAQDSVTDVSKNEYVQLASGVYMQIVDAGVEDETDTVILVEGIFDVIALTRKLVLYDNHRVVPVATFGKKISDTQIYKLQSKGVRSVIIAYDADATDAINKTAIQLNEFFDVTIAKLIGNGKDFDEMDFWEVYDVFAYNLQTPVEFKLNTLDEKI